MNTTETELYQAQANYITDLLNQLADAKKEIRTLNRANAALIQENDRLTDTVAKFVNNAFKM
jgi:hypothetical protein